MTGSALRVLQLSDFALPAAGGLERVVFDLSRGLAARGHTVVHAALTPDPSPVPGVRSVALGSATSRLPGVHADPRRPFHPPFPDPATVAELDRLVREFRPDVVHAHSWVLNSWLPLRRRHPGTSTVLYAHDYGTFCARKTNDRPDGSECDRPSLGRCLPCARPQYGALRTPVLVAGLAAMRSSVARVASASASATAVGSSGRAAGDAIVAVSSRVARALRTALSVPSVEVIPPATDLRPADLRDVPPPRPDFLPDRPFVLYVGQLSRHKGVDVLLRAMQHLPGVPLVVLGLPKPGEPVPSGPDVVVRSDVGHDVVMSAWRHAAVGVVPSLWADPMPLVALEAMSQGCPLVVSAVGGLVDSVQDGTNGVHVPPGDDVALAAAIGGLLRDPERRRGLSEAAVQRYGRFGLEAVLDQWLALYGRLIGAERAVHG